MKAIEILSFAMVFYIIFCGLATLAVTIYLKQFFIKFQSFSESPMKVLEQHPSSCCSIFYVTSWVLLKYRTMNIQASLSNLMACITWLNYEWLFWQCSNLPVLRSCTCIMCIETWSVWNFDEMSEATDGVYMIHSSPTWAICSNKLQARKTWSH